ncbi:MAG TPA: flagellar FliJ family protein [Polyangiales bacterium]
MDQKRIKRLLDLKRRLEKVKKGEVVEARQELDAAQQRLLAAEREQQQRLCDLQGDNSLSIDELADRARFVVLAGQAVGQARDAVCKHDEIVAEREEARVAATRDVRTFELLDERKKEERRVVDKRLEQGAADEVAGSRRSRS